MDQNNNEPINSFGDTGVKFSDSYQVKRQSNLGYSRIIQLVMKLSKGKIQTEQQANVVLIIIAIVATILSIFFFISSSSSSEPIETTTPAGQTVQ